MAPNLKGALLPAVGVPPNAKDLGGSVSCLGANMFGAAGVAVNEAVMDAEPKAFAAGAAVEPSDEADDRAEKPPVEEHYDA